MSSQVVRYVLDDGTTTTIEIEPTPGFQPAGFDEVAGKVREALGSAVGAAQTVLDEVRKTSPEQIQVKFGLKVTGTTDWLVAKSSAEANFEVTMTWSALEK